MARAKKEYRNLTIKLDKTISDALEEYCKKMGQTKTTAIERILKSHFDKMNDNPVSSSGKEPAS